MVALARTLSSPRLLSHELTEPRLTAASARASFDHGQVPCVRLRFRVQPVGPPRPWLNVTGSSSPQPWVSRAEMCADLSRLLLGQSPAGVGTLCHPWSRNHWRIARSLTPSSADSSFGVIGSVICRR